MMRGGRSSKGCGSGGRKVKEKGSRKQKEFSQKVNESRIDEVSSEFGGPTCSESSRTINSRNVKQTNSRKNGDDLCKSIGAISLSSTFSEVVEQLSESKPGKPVRLTHLEKLLSLLTSKPQCAVISGISETLFTGLMESISRGSTTEILIACECFNSSILSMGEKFLSQSLYSYIESALRRVYRVGAQSAVRGAAALAYGLLICVGCGQDDKVAEGEQWFAEQSQNAKWCHVTNQRPAERSLSTFDDDFKFEHVNDSAKVGNVAKGISPLSKIETLAAEGNGLMNGWLVLATGWNYTKLSNYNTEGHAQDLWTFAKKCVLYIPKSSTVNEAFHSLRLTAGSVVGLILEAVWKVRGSLQKVDFHPSRVAQMREFLSGAASADDLEENCLSEDSVSNGEETKVVEEKSDESVKELNGIDEVWHIECAYNQDNGDNGDSGIGKSQENVHDKERRRERGVNINNRNTNGNSKTPTEEISMDSQFQQLSNAQIQKEDKKKDYIVNAKAHRGDWGSKHLSDLEEIEEKSVSTASRRSGGVVDVLHDPGGIRGRRGSFAAVEMEMCEGDVLARVGHLVADSHKGTSKTDKREITVTFRDVLRTCELGEVPSKTICIGGRDRTVTFTGWSSNVRYELLKKIFKSALSLHLEQNSPITFFLSLGGSGLGSVGSKSRNPLWFGVIEQDNCACMIGKDYRKKRSKATAQDRQRQRMQKGKIVDECCEEYCDE